MKGILKKAGLALATGILACVCLVGCGEISKSDIVGDWTVDTVNGMSLADYAASLGLTEGQVVTNLTIRDDDTMVSESALSSDEFDIERKADGFEVKQKGKSEIFMSVKYDADAQTLTYSVEDGQGGTVTQVMKKGKGTIEPLTTEGAETTEGTDEEYVEDEGTGEEEYVEEGAEEEYVDEGETEVEEEEGYEE